MLLIEFYQNLKASTPDGLMDNNVNIIIVLVPKINSGFFPIRDEQIVLKSGRDAVQYLMFQRYLLVYMACITVLSIVVILPVNFQGDLGQ